MCEIDHYFILIKIFQFNIYFLYETKIFVTFLVSDLNSTFIYNDMTKIVFT